MSRIHTAAAYLLGAVAGALLSAGFAIGPTAHADVLPTLPVPPFDPPVGHYISLPGDPSVQSDQGSTYLLIANFSHDHQLYLLPDGGSYEVEDNNTLLGTLFTPVYTDLDAKVIASDGASAPAVGTNYDQSVFGLYFFGSGITFATNDTLSTGDGVVDVTGFPSIDLDNIFYQGPAGTIDYLVYGPGTPDVGYVPIFDIPAAGDTAAALNPADLAGLGDVTSLASLMTEIQTLF